MKMRKIVAIVAAVLMLFSVIPFSAMAAEVSYVKIDKAADLTEGTYKMAAYLTVDSNKKDLSATPWHFATGAVSNDMTTVSSTYDEATGAIGTANAADVVLTAVDNKAGYYYITINGKYLYSSSANTNRKLALGTTQAEWQAVDYSKGGIALYSNGVTLGSASAASSFLRSYKGTPSATPKYGVYFFKVKAAEGDCAHEYTDCEDTVCDLCDAERTAPGHTWASCEAVSCTACSANRTAGTCAYSSEYDTVCDVCNATREVTFPEADSVLTILEADALGSAMEHNITTPGKYYVTGKVESIVQTTYGNLYIQDDDGNKLYIYGTYSADGKTQFGSMTEKPVVGMTITVYGVIGNYNNAAQMKNGWITEMISNCEHVWDNDCDTTCDDCGFIREIEHAYVADIVESTCTKAGHASYECSVCFHSYDEELPLAAHNYVNDICSACGAQKPAGYAPITSADQFVSGQYVMVVETGYAPTCFDNGWVLTGQPAITNDVISADDAAGYLWTLTVDGNSVTITDANGVSIAPKSGNTNGIQSGDYKWTWSFADGKFIFSGTGSDTTYFASNTTANSGDNKFRAYKHGTCTGNSGASYKYKFTLYAASIPSQPECAHEYDNACDVDCNLCYETREVSHNVVHVEAVAATCATDGNLEHWYCDVCGMAWLDAECTLNTNLKSVKLPATGEHTYFDACSAICEVCGYEREVSHNIVHVEAEAATCAETGNIEHWYCDVCGAAWLDAECTLNTNLKAIVLPATGEHIYDDEYDADCNVCGDIREVPEKPPVGDVLYGDVNGDGKVTLMDATVLSQYLAGYEVKIDEAASDTNGDGKVTLMDATVLSQYLAGYDVTLGPAEDEEEESKIFNDGVLSGWGE